LLFLLTVPNFCYWPIISCGVRRGDVDAIDIATEPMLRTAFRAPRDCFVTLFLAKTKPRGPRKQALRHRCPCHRNAEREGMMRCEEANAMTDPKLIVHRDPEILGGTLVFVGTRVPVKTLFDYLEAGDSLEVFLDEFPSVSRDQAVAALKLAREIIAPDAHPAR
jgi:uncharacterized protein (DUF433 family)